MKAILTVSVIMMLFAGVMAAAGAEGVLDLSTLGKKPVSETMVLPQLTATMPTNYATNYLGSQASKGILDLSTLGKKTFTSATPGVSLKGSTPITVTLGFSIRNSNITTGANTIITQPQAISANTTIYTPPIAIFGGA
jgi:hypothetical protein